MSSAKLKTKSSVNKQVKTAIKTVRDFLAGKSPEAKVAESDDKELRQVVGAELLAAMAREDRRPKTGDRGAEEDRRPASGDTEGMPRTETDEIFRGAAQRTNLSNPAEMWGEQERAKPTEQQEQERARQLFLDHGYFDETVQDLRAANSPAERAAAARALGIVGNQRATAHLIAAMFDDDLDVRNAAEEALKQIGEPTVVNDPMSALLISELDKEKAEARAASEAVEAVAAESAAQDQDGRGARGSSETVETAAAKSAKSTPRDRTGRFMPAARKEDKGAIAKSKAEDSGAPEARTPIIVEDQAASREEEQLLLEEHAVRETVEQLERQLVETAEVRKKSENEARWRTEREAKLRADATVQRREEEELRKRVEEEAERRRSQEREAVTAEHMARLQAEAEAHRLAEEESRLRLEAAGLRLAAEELSRQRTELETARRDAADAARHAAAQSARQAAEDLHIAELERLRNEEEALRIAVEEIALRRSEIEAANQEAAAEVERLKKEQAKLAAVEAARHAEAERMRREAEERNRAEQEQLTLQLEALRHVSEEVAIRRNEVEAAREKADKDAEQLLAAQARMRAAEEAREQAQVERLQLEAEIQQRAETQQRLLEDARRHAQEEQLRLEEEVRRHTEQEQQRLDELELLKKKAEIETQQRAEKEKQILSQVDSLRIADAEARKRIEDAEVRRRGAEEAFRLAAEKVQRVEAEAHLRAVEEERILAKLEAVRRSAANEAQARAEQEKRVKEEIEQFRRLEEEERPRLEGAMLQRTEAVTLLQQQRDRLKAEEEARFRAEAQLNALVSQQQAAAQEADREESDTEEDILPVVSATADELPTTLPEEVVRAAPQQTSIFVDEDKVEEDDIDNAAEAAVARVETEVIAPGAIGVDIVDEGAASGVPATIAVYLNSVDPYKRAAAVAELARSHVKDAFSVIVLCFDDHSPHVRNAAARAFRKLEPNRTVDLFNRALEGASAERRRNIGGAIAASGLATEAIDNLVSESREDTYNALSILFVMAKTGEVQPLVQAIEGHENVQVRMAAIKLLTLSGQSDIADAAAKRRLEYHSYSEQ